MTNLLDPRHLAQPQAHAILQGMAHVARSDGDDAREVILMRDFWEACPADATDGMQFTEARTAPFDVTSIRKVIDTQELKQTFLAFCLLVAYSDGQASSAEQQTLATLMDELDIDADTAAQTHERVQGLLFQRVDRVSDLEALRSISKQL
jgi:uncharacterized membrane protein YebE (DUF533 family)